MKKNEIKIGESYMAKVTNRIVPVKITRENRLGGWDATNTATGKTIRIKSAARLRKAATVGQITDAKMSKAPSASAARTQGAAKPAPAKQAKKRSRRVPDSPGGRAMSIHRNLAAKPNRVSLLDAAATVPPSARARRGPTRAPRNRRGKTGPDSERKCVYPRCFSHWYQ